MLDDQLATVPESPPRASEAAMEPRSWPTTEALLSELVRVRTGGNVAIERGDEPQSGGAGAPDDVELWRLVRALTAIGSAPYVPDATPSDATPSDAPADGRTADRAPRDDLDALARALHLSPAERHAVLAQVARDIMRTVFGDELARTFRPRFPDD